MTPRIDDRGADAYQIRRNLERAFSEVDSASLRASRSSFLDLWTGLQEIKARLNALRDAAEEARQQVLPATARRTPAQPDEATPSPATTPAP